MAEVTGEAGGTGAAVTGETAEATDAAVMATVRTLTHSPATTWLLVGRSGRDDSAAFDHTIR